MQEALLARAATLPAHIAAHLPRNSQTLHRLLGIGQGTRARYHRDNPLPYDVLVVDEASMIDVAMAAQLFDALSPDTRLVLLGDKDQLAAVEAGAVFAELSARPAFSPAGVAHIARATGIDEARVAAALPHGAASARQEASDFDMFDDAALMSNIDEADIDWYLSHESQVVFEEVPHDAVFGDDVLDTAPATVTATAAPLVDCVIWLERNYRFGLESQIGRLSLAIRRGDTHAALDALESDTTSSAILDEDAGPTLAARTVERLAQGFTPYASALASALAERVPNPVPLFDALNAFRILCATRVGARGIDALNALMAAHVRHAAGVAAGAGTSWFAGRPVMIARNDYALGLFNGDIGIALPAADGALRVYFRHADGGLRAVTPAALPPHETAFALTVHKSQGSEFDHAALVLPSSNGQSASRVLSRELVYTAVTRARRAVRIVGAREVLADAIATPTRRESGLFARMADVLAAASTSSTDNP
jgi:exodeoxyribonuclease V alpha subunit